jgi:hypothetical protein
LITQCRSTTELNEKQNIVIKVGVKSLNCLTCGSVKSQIRHKKRKGGNTNEWQEARNISNGANYFRYCTSAQELTNVKELELLQIV